MGVRAGKHALWGIGALLETARNGATVLQEGARGIACEASTAQVCEVRRRRKDDLSYRHMHADKSSSEGKIK